MEKSEDNLVAWIAERFGRSPASTDLPIGIGDDMAMIRPTADGLLVAADMLMDGVDFDSRVHRPEQIGRKALAVNLSDCAAMAVRPRFALVSVALPNKWSMDQAKQLYLGIEGLAKQFDVQIIGGDTNSWDKPLVIDVTILAEPWSDAKPVTRGGMKAHDLVIVTGELGGSIAGHHLDFKPRVDEAHWLAKHLGDGLHAMMDLSDGISTDASRMCKASDLGIELQELHLEGTASRAAQMLAGENNETLIQHILNDGEDFELLFAVEPRAWIDLTESAAGQATIASNIIPRYRMVGSVIPETGLWLSRSPGKREPVIPAGWQHFK